MSKLIIYAYTTPSLITASQATNKLKVKVGQTKFDHNTDPKISAQRRINKQQNESSHEPLQMIDHWVIETNDDFKSDKDLHKVFIKSNYQQVTGCKATEWFWFPTNNLDSVNLRITSCINALLKIKTNPQPEYNAITKTIPEHTTPTPTLTRNKKVSFENTTFEFNWNHENLSWEISTYSPNTNTKRISISGGTISFNNKPSFYTLEFNIAWEPSTEVWTLLHNQNKIQKTDGPNILVHNPQSKIVPIELYTVHNQTFEIKFHPTKHIWEGFLNDIKITSTKSSLQNTLENTKTQIYNLYKQTTQKIQPPEIAPIQKIQIEPTPPITTSFTPPIESITAITTKPPITTYIEPEKTKPPIELIPKSKPQPTNLLHYILPTILIITITTIISVTLSHQPPHLQPTQNKQPQETYGRYAPETYSSSYVPPVPINEIQQTHQPTQEIIQAAPITQEQAPILSNYYLTKYKTLIATLRNNNKSDIFIFSVVDQFEHGDKIDAEQRICDASSNSFPFCKKEETIQQIPQRELLVEIEQHQ